MARAYTTKNVMDKTHSCFQFDGIWRDVLADPETRGVWLMYGKDKNGKTWGALLLSDYLSQFGKLLYISAEQGLSKSFKDALKRAHISPSNKNLNYIPYETLSELYIRLKKRNAPKVVVIDNITFYKDEITTNNLVQLVRDFPNILFIFLAHEEAGKPYSAPAILANKIAEIIIRVKGLAMIVSGRCPGGTMMIDESKATLYHGQELNTIS